MEEGAKVRLVRCPKCEKLLPEFADYPVYRCGGCDATLQARKLAPVDVSMEKFDEEPVRNSGTGKGFCEEGMELKERLPFGSEVDRENDDFEYRRRESVLLERTAVSNEGSSQDVSFFYMNGRNNENGEVFNGYPSREGFEAETLRFDAQGAYGRKDGPFMVEKENQIDLKTCNRTEIGSVEGREVQSMEKMGVGDFGCRPNIQLKSSGKNAPNSSGFSAEKVINFLDKKPSLNGYVGKSHGHGFESWVINDSAEASHGWDNHEIISRDFGNGVETETGYGGGLRDPSKVPEKNWAAKGLKQNIDEVIQSNLEDREIRGKSSLQEFQKFQQGQNWNPLERDEASGFERNGSPVLGKRRAVHGNLQHWSYPDEGPSKLHGSTYRYGEQVYSQKPHGQDRMENLEQDPMELLSKLDALRDELIKSCSVSDKPKERIPFKSRMVPNSNGFHNTWSPGGSAGSNRNSSQVFALDSQDWSSTCFNHEPQLDFQPVVPLINRHDMDVPHCYPATHAQNEILGPRVPFGTRILGTTSPQRQQYPQRPVVVSGFRANRRNDFLNGHYMNMAPDPVNSYSHNACYQHPVCSCFNCYNKQLQAHKRIPSAVLCNQRMPKAANDQMFCHLGGTGSLGSQDYTSPDSLWHYHESNAHMRRLGDLEPEAFSFRKWHPQRTVHSKGNKRYCQPIAGGSPFITCYNCFELLQLPKNLLLVNKKSHKLRCGACSQVISFAVDGKRLIVSIPLHTKHPASRVSNYYGEMENVGVSYLNHMNSSAVPHSTHASLGDSQNSMNPCSEDYDLSGYKIQSTETEPIFSSPTDNNSRMQKEYTLTYNRERLGGRAKFIESDKVQDLSLSSSSSEEDEPEGFGIHRDRPKSTELSLKADTTPSLVSHANEHSSSNELMTKFGKGSRSKRSDGLVSSKNTFKQNSVKDASVATEIDFSWPTDSDPVISQDSAEVVKEANQPKINKAGESFFAGLIKKSFRDFTRSNQSLDNGKSYVSVNGKPLPDRLVKKAEKQAGPIHPGQYWYDYRAGFWGVIGHHCLGIIPPFIEEFSYPMSKNCSGGNTGVFVNGRELHQKDLDLLAGRGLPTTRDKSYIIEINGTVMDEASGEELDGLGKLAPTVEKVKHGFGMRVPRAIAEMKIPATTAIDS